LTLKFRASKHKAYDFENVRIAFWREQPRLPIPLPAWLHIRHTIVGIGWIFTFLNFRQRLFDLFFER
jgi:hypothetical protein